MNSFFLVLGLLIAVPSPESTGLGQSGTFARTAVAEHIPGAVPQKALDVYNYVILHGRAPEGIVGGTVWHNREKILPRGNYREFDVNPKKKGVNRGAERIVIDFDTNRGWYTADHYRTFVPIPSTHRKEHKDAKSGFHVHGP